MKIKADYVNTPQWKELTVKSRLPEQLKCLDELAHNLWWAWDYEARDLFTRFYMKKCNTIQSFYLSV